ncbi:MAG: FAD-binding oxidoreductase, partial [Sandaracinaceae bacterium]
MTDRRPPWRSPRTRLGSPPDRVDADVAVVGGGITGLTLALLLAEAGVDVALFERDRLGAGVTGKSTGHLTTLPDLGLARAIDAHGEERAASVVDAMARTVDALERRAAALAPQAFERVDGYLFAEPEGDVEALRGELAAARRLGLPVTEDAPPGLPFEVEAAMRLPGQAKLSPGVWLEALAAA